MIKKISIDELEPGMEIVQLSSDMWKHLPYLYAESGTIESAEQIAQIKQKGYQQAFVEIPEENMGMTDEQRLDQLISEKEHATTQRSRVPFQDAITDTQVTYEAAMSSAMRIVTDAKLGRKIDYDTAVETASAIVDCAMHNPDTLVCLSKLSAFDNYTYTHSINVAAIAVVFGEYIGMSRNELIDLGMAGMMHDLGKTTVPPRIINKPSKLTRTEFEEVRRHPGYGFSILEHNRDIPPKVLEAVKLHHEKFNGTGYPKGLTRKDIPAFARIICMADVYDALTSNRCYRGATTPNKALGIMYGMREQDFDPLEIQLFIKCLGIFPAGSLVKLNSGEYALVYESNSSQPLSPKIKIVMNQTMHPIQTRDVDLSDQNDNGHDTLEILECADPTMYRKILMDSLTVN